MVWAKAGPFASLGTADRRAFALAHCNQYKSERLYCQYRRSLIQISQCLSEETLTCYPKRRDLVSGPIASVMAAATSAMATMPK